MSRAWKIRWCDTNVQESNENKISKMYSCIKQPHRNRVCIALLWFLFLISAFTCSFSYLSPFWCHFCHGLCSSQTPAKYVPVCLSWGGNWHFLKGLKYLLDCCCMVHARKGSEPFFISYLIFLAATEHISDLCLLKQSTGGLKATFCGQ